MSFTLETKLPAGAGPASRAWIRPGFDVARYTSPDAVRRRLVTCSAGKDASMVQVRSSWIR